jgi:hypothetical protein
MLFVVTNRKLQQHPKLQPRIMVVQLSKDISSTYNAVMNSIFRYLIHLPSFFYKILLYCALAMT